MSRAKNAKAAKAAKNATLFFKIDFAFALFAGFARHF